MAEASGKSGGPTISSIAAPTADIDDEWALDDEPARAPVATSPSGQAALDAQTGASLPTEEIDSEWPDDAVTADQNADQLRKPKIPLAPKLPEEAAAFEKMSSPVLAVGGTATPSDRPSERTIDAFERAAASTGRGAFGIRSSAPPAPASTPPASTPPASAPPTSSPPASAPPSSAPRVSAPSSSAPAATASSSEQPPSAAAPPETDAVVAPASAPFEVRTKAETATTPEVATSTAPVTRAASAPPASSAPPPASKPAEARESEPPASKSKKGARVGYGLAAAAVAIVGLGLVLRSPNAAEPAPERKLEPTEAKPAAAALPHAETPSAPEPSAAAPVMSAAAETSAGEAAGTPDAKGSEEASAESEGASDAKTPPEAAASAEAADGGAPVLVTVHIYPPEAEIYHKGKRLGRSGQQIEVLPGERKLLVLIRDGYWPRKLVLDGKETTYNIGLRKMPEGAATTAPAAPKFTPQAP